MPSAAPSVAERRRLDEELGQDVAAACAERLPNADLARALGDGDEHDVHDHDRADDEPDRRQRDAGDAPGSPCILFQNSSADSDVSSAKLSVCDGCRW